MGSIPEASIENGMGWCCCTAMLCKLLAGSWPSLTDIVGLLKIPGKADLRTAQHLHGWVGGEEVAQLTRQDHQIESNAWRWSPRILPRSEPRPTAKDSPIQPSRGQKQGGAPGNGGTNFWPRIFAHQSSSVINDGELACSGRHSWKNHFRRSLVWPILSSSTYAHIYCHDYKWLRVVRITGRLEVNLFY